MNPDTRTAEEIEESIQRRLDAILAMEGPEVEPEYPEWFKQLFSKYIQ